MHRRAIKKLLCPPTAPFRLEELRMSGCKKKVRPEHMACSASLLTLMPARNAHMKVTGKGLEAFRVTGWSDSKKGGRLVCHKENNLLPP